MKEERMMGVVSGGTLAGFAWRFLAQYHVECSVMCIGEAGAENWPWCEFEEGKPYECP